MRLDPIFQREMLSHKDGKDYFMFNKAGLRCGTKFFFQAYHNCVDNLWLISTAANTGQGKGSQEPIQWLRGHRRYGEEFFSSFKGEEKIDRSKILYCIRGVDDSETLLASKAKDWFLLRYREELQGVGYVRHEIALPAKRRLELIPKEAITRKSKKQRIDLMLRLSLARAVINGPSSDTSSSSSSSPSTSDAEITPGNQLKSDKAIEKELGTVFSVVKRGRKNYKCQPKQQSPDI